MQTGTPGEQLKRSCRHQPQVQKIGRMIGLRPAMMLLYRPKFKFLRFQMTVNKILGSAREKRQVLAEYFFRRPNPGGYALSLRVTGFTGKSNGDPIKRVGKNRVHTSRFGRP